MITPFKGNEYQNKERLLTKDTDEEVHSRTAMRVDTHGSIGSGGKTHHGLIGGASVANLPAQMKGSRSGKAPYRLLVGNRKANTINDRGLNAA